ncbi:MAG: NAD-dependent epimerase/dehydratase family protein [Planctomycetota bacterium]
MAIRLIFGCGYVGARVAKRWLDAGDTVWAVTRSRPTAAGFADAGLRPIVADVSKRETLQQLPAADTVLFAVGYDRSSEASIGEVYAGGVRNVLAALPEATRRFVYVSTTGVYGDAGGDWVDEATPPAPARDGGRASLAAEGAVRESPWGDRSACLRLAGIYGPDRLPYVAKLEAGDPIEAPASGWLNLIHVEDAATAVLAASDADPAPGVVCVSDGDPPQRGDYYAEVARLLDAPPPTFTVPAADSPRAARAASDKRVRNKRLVETLGVSLRYPTHREGLAAIIGRSDLGDA